ncbi:hypothetical protein ACFFQW_07370 [Umezawaea endophytica]|uniref:Secreted protein n=1 Tax=Umezawaea endophytica TaxID=1654476 RepID=A0A9X2VRC0_9PSEU|nr:hypothetical protein [Umezawaea endophytica]MCS7480083.1 hypothetical protein [Umezawaea endophytica]
MKKIATVIPLITVLFAASVIPAAAVPSRSQTVADPPAACLDLVTKLSDTVKKAIAPLTALPPDPGKVAAPLGDSLGVLTQMQSSKCLPTPPVSVPTPPIEVPVVPTTGFQGPEQCLSAAMNLFSIVFGILSKVVPGGGVPDVTKLLAEVTGLLKALTDTLAACGLPAPPGGLPSVPSLPTLPAPGLPIPAPGLPGLPAAA